jgi:hypothetical protein
MVDTVIGINPPSHHYFLSVLHVIKLNNVAKGEAEITLFWDVKLL